METEVRYYFNHYSENDLVNYLKSIKELNYEGMYYERTDQYNHPMKKYNFYDPKIDGRFRVRITKSNDIDKCMITWKRRLKDNKKELIHQEEEVEVAINSSEYRDLCFLLTNVIHLELKESYERYRHVFKNNDVEIVVDKYPFGIALEIESKSKSKDAYEIIKNWIIKLSLKLEEAYPLSWDDKYEELCKEQNIEIFNIVTFDKKMPQVINKFKTIQK